MYIRATILLGFLLILLGLVGIFDSNLFFRRDTAERGIGPLRLLNQETENVPAIPLLSGVVLLSGIALVAAGAKKS